MSDHKKSGELILKNLQIFSDAVYLFQNSIEPKIHGGIDQCIEKFSRQNDWEGDFQLKDNNENWLRPKKWKTEDGLDAWFSIESTQSDDDGDNYWLSLFCKNASNNFEAGFFFRVETKNFGGKRTWDAHIRRISEDLEMRLKQIGFKKFNGHFFLPIELNNEELAKSWLEEDPYTPDDDCFKPLHTALEKLKESVPIFFAIMASAPTSQRS